MDVDALAAQLGKMYRNASYGEKTTSLQLFGIMYSQELSGVSVERVVDRSGLRRDTGRTRFGKEIDDGRRLARYVQLRTTDRQPN